MTISITKIEQLFDAAVDVPPKELAGWLDSNCAADDVLRRRLEQLLAADATNSDGMLDEPVVSRASEEMPMRVGPFTPIRVIGEGGMGVVFEATQEGTGRSVALKLVRAGLASPKGMRRFRQEGELLARLNHPGIAHVYDAGTARAEYAHGASGDRLFVAMELIVGVNVLEYATREKLSLGRRVEIIEQLAHAMQHAHQRRVLHRDLKPSNILVDEEGQPKILDFGIGRIISPTNATGQTMTGQILGTAQYMSPEQAAGDLARVDTRTDVYALGVILYELLAGQPAYELGGLSAIAAARRVAEQEPRRLASVVPECRGDLDAIVHKAIERDPDSRYESADALASDLRRFLNDEVVDARSPTTLQAALKYARRHRTLVGGVVATTIALILGVIGTSIYGFRAAEQRSIAVWESYRLAMQASASAIELGSFDEARDALDRAPSEHRGWEHAHIQSRLDQWMVSYDGPARGCPCAVPDETRVLSSLEDGRVGVWDIASGESIGTFDLGTSVTSLARAAPNGIAAAAATDGGIVLFSAQSGEAIRLLLGEEDAPFIDVQFGESGKLVLGWNHDVAVVARTDGSGIALRIAGFDESNANPANIYSAAINRQGTHMALYMSGHLYAYDLRSQERILENWFGPPAVSMFIAPGGMILTGDSQRTVKVFSDTLQEPAVLTGHRARLIADVVTTGDDLVISVDALAANEPLDAASRSIRLWDPLKNRAVGVLAMPPGREAVRLLPLAGERFITGGAIDTPMLLWAHDRQEKTLLGRHKNDVYNVTWSPDGQLVASSSYPGIERFVRVWGVETRREVARLRSQWSTLATLVFSRDGAQLFFQAVSGPDGSIEAWSTEAWTRITDHVTDPELIVGIGGAAGARLHRGDCFSPDGSMRAFAEQAFQGPLHIYLSVSGRRHELPGFTRRPSFAFSPDGKILAATSPPDRAIRLISTSSFKEIRRVEVGLIPRSLDFSPDGQRLAVVGFASVIRLFDTQWWEPIVDLRGHTATIHDVQFSPDGRSLATASSDRTVRIWTTPPAASGSTPK